MTAPAASKNTPLPQPKPYVAGLSPYIPGRPTEDVAKEFGITDIAKLASNENPLGSPDGAKKAVIAATEKLHLYPDNGALELLGALAQKHDLPAENIALSAGSSHMLELIARGYAGAGDEVIYPQYGFICYPIFTRAVGAVGVPVPEVNYTADPAAMAAAVSEKTKIIFLANPNNPTGTMVSEAALRGMLASMPPEVLVVVDEAYANYAQAEGGVDATTLLADYPNLVVTRTFSKIYGLAALRVGYALGHPEVIATLRKLCPPFSVSTPGQKAALAALADGEFVQKSVEHNKTEKTRLAAAYKEMGLLACPSYANFLLLDVRPTGKTPAELFEALQKQGVIPRPVGAYGLNHHLRLSVGTRAENDKALAGLKALAV